MDPTQVLFTCLSCSIAFVSAEEQRDHYRSDFHRYNMKRRVASLPPVSAAVFDNKVLERRAEDAIVASTAERKQRRAETAIVASTKDNSTPDQEVERAIDEKIAAARARLSSTSCLFCSFETETLEDNLTHMSQVHSFFIPDANYLVDISGLITYLGEKIAVGNVCIFCNDKGRKFRSFEAVRKHMIDKSHCKIAYDSADDRLEISDFYDFTSSYPDAESRKKRENVMEHDQDWEDVESGDESDADEVIDATASDESGLDSDSDDSIPDNQITYGDSHLELVLPSGARIGHRSMRRYYAQTFSSGPSKPADPNSGAALVRRLLADKNSALVPRKGGFGAFGSGMEVVKARNRGEAREAGRHVREFRDQKRREDFKTKVAFIHNSQKHFRDPLLQ